MVVVGIGAGGGGGSVLPQAVWRISAANSTGIKLNLVVIFV